MSLLKVKLPRGIIPAWSTVPLKRKESWKQQFQIWLDLWNLNNPDRLPEIRTVERYYYARTREYLRLRARDAILAGKSLSKLRHEGYHWSWNE